MAAGTAWRSAATAVASRPEDSAAESAAMARSCVVYVFVAATASSGPASRDRTWSAAVASGEPGSFVIAIDGAPCRRASSRTATMSGDSPDWEMPMTSASAIRGGAPKMENIDGAASATGARSGCRARTARRSLRDRRSHARRSGRISGLASEPTRRSRGPCRAGGRGTARRPRVVRESRRAASCASHHAPVQRGARPQASPRGPRLERGAEACLGRGRGRAAGGQAIQPMSAAPSTGGACRRRSWAPAAAARTPRSRRS